MKEAAPPGPIAAKDRNFFPLDRVRKTITIEDERPQEECGLFSLYAPNGMTSDEARKVFVGAKGVQHRGQQGAGISARTMTGETFVSKGFGLLPTALPDEVRDQVADLGILRSATIQTRYSTFGGFEKQNLQPIETVDLDGNASDVSQNGSLANTSELRRKSEKEYNFRPSDTRMFTDTLYSHEGKTVDDKIVNAVQNIVGAASLVINSGPETQYAARDPRGVRPLILGNIQGELGPIWVVASETKALDMVGATTERDIRPGEVIKFDATGFTVLEKGNKGDEKMCAMEMAYMSNRESRVNVTSNGMSPEQWPSHGENRIKIGRQLAREEKARELATKQRVERQGKEYVPFKPALVIGVPESGKPSGKGYAEEMDAPYAQFIVKDPDNDNRMFQADENRAARKAGILTKLHFKYPDNWDWTDKDIVLTDDSLVRGDASTVLTEVLTALGARVHWRFGFPPIVNPCHLGVNIKTHEELIAFRNGGDRKAIAKEIGAASVEYISNRGFVESVQGDHFEPSSEPKDVFDKNRMCGGCITGEYPYAPEDMIQTATLVSH